MGSRIETVDDILQRILISDPKIKDVLIADSTGALISYMTRRVDAISPFEILASISGSNLSEMGQLGEMLGLGEPIEDLREYENGVFLYHPIETQAVILVIGERGINIGLIRTLLQKYTPEIKRILSEQGIGVKTPELKELSGEELEKISAYMSMIENLDIMSRSFLPRV